LCGAAKLLASFNALRSSLRGGNLASVEDPATNETKYRRVD